MTKGAGTLTTKGIGKLDFRDVMTDPLMQGGKQDAIDALQKAGALRK